MRKFRPHSNLYLSRPERYINTTPPQLSVGISILTNDPDCVKSRNEEETNRTLTNQLTVMKDEKEKLAAEHTKLKQSYEKLIELFQPLIKAWNEFI